MKPTALLFNMTKEDLVKIGLVSIRAGFKINNIPAFKHSMTLGEIMEITEDDEGKENENADSEINEKMIVFCNFDGDKVNETLRELKAAEVVIPLKALLTDTNRNWSAAQLFSQLSEERRIFTEAMARYKKEHPEHHHHHHGHED